MDALLERVGPVDSIAGELDHVNEGIYFDRLDEFGDAATAASLTPAAGNLRHLGYSNLDFNPSTMVLPGRK
jgi:hypothetical protein